jgi:hypothetical protein
MTDQHDDDGSPTSGGPSSSDPYAPPPPGWHPPTAPVAMPPPDWKPQPAQWSPQPPPYAAPPDWKPPPPPYPGGTGGGQPTAPGTWQPAGAPGTAAGWPPVPDSGATPYGWAPPYPGSTGKTNGFCVASLVLAVPPVCLFTVGLGSLLGVIFGIIGLRQTRRDSSRGRGMAITGIVLGALGLLVGALIIVGIVVSNSKDSQQPDNGSNDTISTMSTPAGLAPAASDLYRRT